MLKIKGKNKVIKNIFKLIRFIFNKLNIIWGGRLWGYIK